jgi:hypothetical protein
MRRQRTGQREPRTVQRRLQVEARYKSGKPVSVADLRREIEFVKSAGKLSQNLGKEIALTPSQPLILEIMASLCQRYAPLNRHYEAGWTESFIHLRCHHRHETLIDAAMCAARQGMPGWYVFAVEFDSPRQLTEAEDKLVNDVQVRSHSVHTSPLRRPTAPYRVLCIP